MLSVDEYMKRNGKAFYSNALYESELPYPFNSTLWRKRIKEMQVTDINYLDFGEEKEEEDEIL